MRGTEAPLPALGLFSCLAASGLQRHCAQKAARTSGKEANLGRNGKPNQPPGTTSATSHLHLSSLHHDFQPLSDVLLRCWLASSVSCFICAAGFGRREIRWHGDRTELRDVPRVPQEQGRKGYLRLDYSRTSILPQRKCTRLMPIDLELPAAVSRIYLQASWTPWKISVMAQYEEWPYSNNNDEDASPHSNPPSMLRLDWPRL